MKNVIAHLEQYLQTLVTNEPINRKEGGHHLAQADLEALAAAETRQALAILRAVGAGPMWPQPAAEAADRTSTVMAKLEQFLDATAAKEESHLKWVKEQEAQLAEKEATATVAADAPPRKKRSFHMLVSHPVTELPHRQAHEIARQMNLVLASVGRADYKVSPTTINPTSADTSMASFEVNWDGDSVIGGASVCTPS